MNNNDDSTLTNKLSYKKNLKLNENDYEYSTPLSYRNATTPRCLPRQENCYMYVFKKLAKPLTIINN